MTTSLVVCFVSRKCFVFSRRTIIMSLLIYPPYTYILSRSHSHIIAQTIPSTEDSYPGLWYHIGFIATYCLWRQKQSWHIQDITWVMTFCVKSSIQMSTHVAICEFDLGQSVQSWRHSCLWLQNGIPLHGGGISTILQSFVRRSLWGWRDLNGLGGHKRLLAVRVSMEAVTVVSLSGVATRTCYA